MTDPEVRGTIGICWDVAEMYSEVTVVFCDVTTTIVRIYIYIYVISIVSSLGKEKKHISRISLNT